MGTKTGKGWYRCDVSQKGMSIGRAGIDVSRFQPGIVYYQLLTGKVGVKQTSGTCRTKMGDVTITFNTGERQADSRVRTHTAIVVTAHESRETGPGGFWEWTIMS